MIRATCSWCHVENSLVIGARNLCKFCFHRSDLPRCQCNCVACLGLFADLGDDSDRANLLALLDGTAVASVITKCDPPPAGDDKGESSLFKEII